MDEIGADLAGGDVEAVLNVAQDLHSTRGWFCGVEAAHVGLIDGPGNEPAAYYAAVLALHMLLKRHNVLVCCHSGGRALAVAVMYMQAMWVRRGWDEWVTVLTERIGTDLPLVNEVHRRAFEDLRWELLVEATDR